MHGVNRAEYKVHQTNRAIRSSQGEKAIKINTLTNEVLKRYKAFKNKKPELAELPTTTPKSTSTSIEQNATRNVMEQNLTLTSNLLVVNPDPYFIWNFRKELLSSGYTKDDDEANAIFDINVELHLTAKCLKRNPKTYGTWVHRKWSIQFWIQKTVGKDIGNINNNNTNNLCALCDPILDTELELCKQFLNLDERNFHCWNYRRFVVAAKAFVSWSSSSNNNNAEKSFLVDGSWNWLETTSSKIIGAQISNSSTSSPSSLPYSGGYSQKCLVSSQTAKDIIAGEWDFTTEKIQKNFSNYSAFHYRSLLIVPYLEIQWMNNNDASSGPQPSINERYQGVLNVAKEELLLTQQAMFTEPDDQAAWWYHRFLIDDFMKLPENETLNQSLQDSYVNMIETEMELIKELVETEDGQCKWGLLTLQFLCDKLCSVPTTDASMRSELMSSQNEYLEALINVDPDRSRRYIEMIEKLQLH